MRFYLIVLTIIIANSSGCVTKTKLALDESSLNSEEKTITYSNLKPEYFFAFNHLQNIKNATSSVLLGAAIGSSINSDTLYIEQEVGASTFSSKINPQQQLRNKILNKFVTKYKYEKINPLSNEPNDYYKIATDYSSENFSGQLNKVSNAEQDLRNEALKLTTKEQGVFYKHRDSASTILHIKTLKWELKSPSTLDLTHYAFIYTVEYILLSSKTSEIISQDSCTYDTRKIDPNKTDDDFPKYDEYFEKDGVLTNQLTSKAINYCESLFSQSLGV